MGYITWFGKFEMEVVGNKAKSINRLSDEGFNIPKGFVLTNEAYEEFSSSIKNKNILEEIETIEMPPEIVLEIETAYNSLNFYRLNDKLRAFDLLKHGENVEVSIRTDDNSKLNVKGAKQILNTIKFIYINCIMHKKTNCPVIIQKMIKSDVSGEIYSFYDKIIIDACFGLGQNRKYSGADRYELNRDSFETKITHFLQTFAYYGGSGRVEEIELNKKANERKLKNEQMQKLKEIYINAEGKIGKNIRLKFAIENNEIFIISLFADEYYVKKSESKFFDKIDDSKTFENKFAKNEFTQNKLEQNEEKILNEMKDEFREKLQLDIIKPEKMSNADLYDAYREEIVREDDETRADKNKMLEQIEAEEEKELEEMEKSDEEINLHNYKEEVENEISGEKLSAQSMEFSKVPKFEINEYIKNISGENPKIGDIREINELLHDIDEEIERNDEKEIVIDSKDETEIRKEINEEELSDEEENVEDEKGDKIKKYADHIKDSLDVHNGEKVNDDDESYVDEVKEDIKEKNKDEENKDDDFY